MAARASLQTQPRAPVRLLSTLLFGLAACIDTADLASGGGPAGAAVDSSTEGDSEPDGSPGTDAQPTDGSIESGDGTAEDVGTDAEADAPHDAASDSFDSATEGGGADTGRYNFETDTQGWGYDSGGPITSVQRTLARAYLGVASLEVDLNGSGNAVAVFKKDLSVSAGTVVTFHVWVPIGSNITEIQGFAYETTSPYRWFGTDLAAANFALDAWNTVEVTVPAWTAGEIGLQLTTSGSFTGAVYVDSVTW